MIPDRCKTVATVADAVERWGNRLNIIQEGDSSFIIGEPWKISLLAKMLPEDLANAVALRVEEFGESYEKARAFIMKYAAQHR